MPSCNICATRCALCVILAHCTSCEGTVTMIADDCFCAQRSYMASSTTCQPCPGFCQTCTSPIYCTSCPVDFQILRNYCVCAQGFYSTAYTCRRCEERCRTCTGGANKCLSCFADFTYDPDFDCVCPLSTYEVTLG